MKVTIENVDNGFIVRSEELNQTCVYENNSDFIGKSDSSAFINAMYELISLFTDGSKYSQKRILITTMHGSDYECKEDMCLDCKARDLWNCSFNLK